MCRGGVNRRADQEEERHDGIYASGLVMNAVLAPHHHTFPELQPDDENDHTLQCTTAQQNKAPLYGKVAPPCDDGLASLLLIHGVNVRESTEASPSSKKAQRQA